MKEAHKGTETYTQYEFQPSVIPRLLLLIQPLDFHVLQNLSSAQHHDDSTSVALLQGGSCLSRAFPLNPPPPVLVYSEYFSLRIGST